MDAIDALADVLDAYNVVPDTRAELWDDWSKECDRRMSVGDGVLRPSMLFEYLFQSALSLRENAVRSTVEY